MAFGGSLCGGGILANPTTKRGVPGAVGGSAIAQFDGVAQQHYTKVEHRIPMRDGVHLHTVVYQPKDASAEKTYPFVMLRTPYSCRPYGPNEIPSKVGPPEMQKEGYIFVKQDVRGRWMSDGTYDNMRPHVPGDANIDESSDTYDTIEWLLKNLPHNNGKVGLFGISYPGFYSAAALPEAHPALVAVSPQASIADFYFDDFHHQGAYTLMYWQATATFGYQHSSPQKEKWYDAPKVSAANAYDFYLNLGAVGPGSKQYYGADNFFWRQLAERPNYDDFWQARSILPHLKNVTPNVMTVGGWFDAEDLYGPLNIYRSVERNNPDAFNVLVMGPWSHGQWSKKITVNQVGNVVFGENISTFFQREIEAPFFRHFLKGSGDAPNFEALMFDTGRREWKAFDKWPPVAAREKLWYPFDENSLSDQRPGGDDSVQQFVSDPAQPVPYRKRSDMKLRFTPRPYMTDNQKFASGRDDVLVFQTDVLEEDITLAGPLTAQLKISTDQTDADWIVKLIDVYPDGTPNNVHAPDVDLAGYQQMVRSEVFRSRFRNSFAKPEPLVPNTVTEINVPLQDVFHTFRKGHRMMIHVQSSWFPLIDRNPQKYVDNIFFAKPDDYVKATHRVFTNRKHTSSIRTLVLP